VKGKNKNYNDDPVYRTHPAFKEERKQDALQRIKQPFQRRSLYIQLGLFAVVLIFWKIPIINPVKLMVVLFHELSHVFIAYLTGGVVFGIAIDPGGAGVTLGVGGDQFLILAGGYIGSLLIGILLYILSAIWEPDDVWGVLCGLSCVSMFFGWLNDFTASFGYGAITLMFLSLFILRGETKKFFLRLFATTCCLYPLIDVLGEIYQISPQGFVVGGRVAGSDVSQIAEMMHISKNFIAFLWIMIGLYMVLYLIQWASRKDADIKVKYTFFRKKSKNSFEFPLYNPNDPTKIPEYTIR